MVATGSYYQVVRAVGVKVLKNKLSEYVRLAAGGETVLVTDRDRVVAELVPAAAPVERRSCRRAPGRGGARGLAAAPPRGRRRPARRRVSPSAAAQISRTSSNADRAER